MKVSLKLQDDQSPLLKAKIPISIFSHPFVSSLTTTATNYNDKSSPIASFSLSTNFPSGPSLRLSYNPSTTASSATSTCPFSLSLKSGLGLFGSPHNSPLVFSANFSLSSSKPDTLIPTFSLHFKPQFGHFSLHKTTLSNPSLELDSGSFSASGIHLQPGSCSNSDFGNAFAPESVWQEVKLEPFSVGNSGFGSPNASCANGFYSTSGSGLSPERSLVRKDSKKGGFFGGIAVHARTVMPLTKRVVVNMRWTVNLPAGLGSKMPYLTVNKIGVERIEEVKGVKDKGSESKAGDLESLKGMCFWMRRDLEVLERENKEMKQCFEEMRLGVSTRTSSLESERFGRKIPAPSVDNSTEFGQWSKKNGQQENGARESKKNANRTSDVESELQKAIKAAST